jgi:NADH:ubiquinone oxidoreductase subunit H
MLIFNRLSTKMASQEAIEGAVVTLLERKVLSYIHIRKGPNQVGFVGIFQPFRDAIKLFSREQYL